MSHTSPAVSRRSIKNLWWQPPKHPEFLEKLASWLQRDAYPVDVFRQKIWEDSNFDPALCLVLGQAPHWQGFAMGTIRQKGENRLGFIKMIALCPALRGTGMGRTLVLELERRLFERGVSCIRLGESAPNYLSPGLDPQYTRAWVLFEKLGYQVIGHTFNLALPLSPCKLSVKTGTSFVFRRALASDSGTLLALLKEYWPAWVDEVIPALQIQPIPVFIALAGNEILGFAAYECNNRGAGWFGPMGTAPQARGRGLGRQLLYLVLNSMASEGFKEAIIPWVGPVRFYQRAAGATIARVFFRMQKDKPK